MNRPDLHFRGFAGPVVRARFPGTTVCVLPSGAKHGGRVVTYDGDLTQAVAGQSVTITLADEIDVSRGDVLVAADAPAPVADQFEAHVVWMSEQQCCPGRPYLIKQGTRTVTGTLSQPKYRVNVNTLEHLAATTLELNEIGVCKLSLDRRCLRPVRARTATWAASSSSTG